QSNKRRVSVVQPAFVPEVKDRKIQMLGTAACGLCGLMLGLMGVSYRQYRSGQITTANEVVRDMGLRVVGTVPVISRQLLGRRLPGAERRSNRQQNLMVECMDAIRTMLLCDQSARPKWALMITSANSREGKTVLASHLAVSVARTGRRTLLVDCDFRRPS